MNCIWCNSLTTQIADSLLGLSLSKSKEPGVCLDYGSGKGRFAERLIQHEAHHVYAIEPFGPDPGIDEVEWCTSWEDLPGEYKFDHIFMVEVVEHFLNPSDELEVARSH